MNKRSVKTLALSSLILFAQACAAFVVETHAAPRPAAQAKSKPEAATVYACPMHPEVRSKSRGTCPKCRMALRPASVETVMDAAAPAPAPLKKTEPVKTLRIPDTIVYDQNGTRLNFYTDLVKGKTVAINFIFTTCTTICPPLEATFRRVQQGLGERVGRDVQMISISVDPTTDTPERLKSFSAKFKAGPGWAFITGSKPEIDQLLRALGASVTDKNTHSPMLLVGNGDAGYWTRTYGLASASTIIKVITEAADLKNAPGGDARPSRAPVSSN